MKAKQQAGFTLVEIMIVVAIIGILAAIAIPSLMEQVRKSKRGEAPLNLNKLGKNAKMQYEQTSTFPLVTAAAYPGVPCCGNPEGKCPKTPPPAVWQELGFEINEPNYFNYTYTPTIADGVATSFVATAVADTDCDGTFITYTLTGTAVSGSPSVVLSEPTNKD